MEDIFEGEDQTFAGTHDCRNLDYYSDNVDDCFTLLPRQFSGWYGRIPWFWNCHDVHDDNSIALQTPGSWTFVVYMESFAIFHNSSPNILDC